MRPIEAGSGPAVLPPGHRAGPVTGAVVTLGLAGLLLLPLRDGLSGLGGAADAVHWVLIGVSAVLGLLGLAALAAVLLGGHRVPLWRVDEEGVAVWSRAGSAEVPWDDVLGIGVGYERPPRISGAVRPRQDVAIEVFLRSADPTASYPRAGRLVWTEPPPRPDLPPRRLRVMVVETGVERSLGEAVRAVRPQLWLGAHQRQWNVLPGV